MNVFGIILTLCLTATTRVNLSDFLVISHRGLPSEAPAHTFEGYDLAIEQGSSYLEQDVFLSADGHLIVSHDNKLVDGGLITEMTLEEIQELRTANGEPYYTLNEVFERYGNQVNYVIENKATDHEFMVEKAILQVVSDYDLRDNVILQSFYPESLSFFKSADVSIPRMLLVNEQRNHEVLKDWEQYDYGSMIVLESRMLNEERVTQLKEAGFKVFAYFATEPEKESQRIMELDIDGVFTDYTGRTISLRES